MSITLELSPEAEAILKEESKRQGIAVDDLASTVLISYFGPAEGRQEPQRQVKDVFEERLEAWKAIGKNLPPARPRDTPFQDEVDLGISRADFYGYTEREDGL